MQEIRGVFRQGSRGTCRKDTHEGYLKHLKDPYGGLVATAPATCVSHLQNPYPGHRQRYVLSPSPQLIYLQPTHSTPARGAVQLAAAGDARWFWTKPPHLPAVVCSLAKQPLWLSRCSTVYLIGTSHPSSFGSPTSTDSDCRYGSFAGTTRRHWPVRSSWIRQNLSSELAESLLPFCWIHLLRGISSDRFSRPRRYRRLPSA